MTGSKVAHFEGLGLGEEGPNDTQLLAGMP